MFVPLTAPRERIRVRITEKKPRYWIGELVEVIKPSEARREAPCSYFSRCGGCAWQHISYSEQIEQKKKILASSLRTLEKLGRWETLPFVAAPSEFHYRNRIQVQVRGDRIGFFARGTNDLVEIERCLISEDAINNKLAELRSTEPPSARRLELALTEDLKTTVSEGERDPEAALFSQVNRAQNENLKKHLLETIEGEPDWIMDLYAGAGNLTLPVSERFSNAHLTAVELSRASVERARQRDSEKIEWHAGDVAKILAKMKLRAGKGVIVLDPPRIGCDKEVTRELLRRSPKQIVYVSCNPTTFARDAARLVESGAYRLHTVRGLDMFPQTEHMELIASLLRAAP